MLRFHWASTLSPSALSDAEEFRVAGLDRSKSHNAGPPFTLSAPYLLHEIPDQFDV